MISRSDSRLTLKGMFLMTMAVGITSSSRPGRGGVEIIGGATWPMGGDPPEESEERSDVFWGDSERWSAGEEWSAHCCQRESAPPAPGGSRVGAHRWQAATDGPALEGRRADGRVRRLSRCRSKVELLLLLLLLLPRMLTGDVKVVGVVQTVLRGRDGEGGKIGGRRGAGHDHRRGRLNVR